MEEIKIKQTNEVIYKEVLSNGLSIYLYPNKNVKNYYIGLNTKFGGKDTKFKLKDEEEYREVPNGLAHFLEHITLHMDGMEAADLFAPYGTYINAFTSHDYTCYVAAGNMGFNESLDNLLYYVYTPYYTEETVKNEKGIIKEESKMNDDDPDRVFYMRKFQALFEKLNYRHKVVGTIEEIESISLQNINDAYNYFYHPGNMFLIITGNFDKDEAMKTINERMNQFDFGEYKEPELFKIDEPTKVNEKLHKETSNTLTNKASYMIKIPFEDIEKTGLSKFEYFIYLDLILDANLSATSSYYDELMDKDIVPNGSSVWPQILSNFLIINVSNSPKEGKIDEFIDVTQKYINNLVINEEDIRRKIKARIADYILSFDDNEMIFYNVQSDILDFDDVRNDYLDILKSFDENKGEKIIDSIDFSNKSIVIMEPNNL